MKNTEVIFGKDKKLIIKGTKMKYIVTFDKSYKHYHLVENVEVVVDAKKVNHAKKRGRSKLKNKAVKVYKEIGKKYNEKAFREYLNTLPIIAKKLTKNENTFKIGDKIELFNTPISYPYYDSYGVVIDILENQCKVEFSSEDIRLIDIKNLGIFNNDDAERLRMQQNNILVEIIEAEKVLDRLKKKKEMLDNKMRLLNI